MQGHWVVTTPKEAAGFSAVGFYFGRELYRRLKIPLGLIHTSWGGTPAEAWTGHAGLTADPSFKAILDRYDKELADLPRLRREHARLLAEWESKYAVRDEGNKGEGLGYARPEQSVAGWKKMNLPQLWESAGLNLDGSIWFRKEVDVPQGWAGRDLTLSLGPIDDYDTTYFNGERVGSTGNQNSPSVLYNAMLAPLTPYAVRGAVWYQGESNAGRAYQYRALFPAMIRDWRSAWGAGDFPFYFVQLANWKARKTDSIDSEWAELREAQTMTMRSVPHTGMAVTIDIGNPDDIHPRNKLDVGLRLARWALAADYGQKLEESGPLYDSNTVGGDKVRVRFKHAAGLKTSDGGAPKGFFVAGDDHKFHPAEARIEGDAVVVWSREVSRPVAVRYAWADNPACNLYNGANLPASPFRTDDWPGLTAGRN